MARNNSRSLIVTLDDMAKTNTKTLKSLVEDAVKHSKKFYPGEWAEIVRQAAIVGAIGEARSHHPRDTKVEMALIVRRLIADSPSDVEEGGESPMEWVMGREYGSAIIDVLDQLPDYE